MSRALVLDSEALAALGGRASKRQEEARAAMRAAAVLQRDVVVPAVILAELYRGPGHNQMIDACLARETGLRIRDTDRSLARLVGGVLTGAKADSGHLADAHVVAAAVEVGGGVVLTGDEGDLAMLASPYPNITVQPLPLPRWAVPLSGTSVRPDRHRPDDTMAVKRHVRWHGTKISLITSSPDRIKCR